MEDQFLSVSTFCMEQGTHFLKNKRILIIEEQLVGVESHHFGQLTDIIQYARDHGTQVDLLSNCQAIEEVSSSLKATKILKGISQCTLTEQKNRWMRFIKRHVHTIQNAMAIYLFLRKKPAYDLVLIPTAWLPHVLMMLPAIFLLKKNIKVISLQFLCYWNIRSLKARYLLWLLRSTLVFAGWFHGDIHLFGQTPLVCQDIKGGSTLKVTWIPDVGSPLGKHLQSNERQAQKPIVFGFYGFGRYEQGVDILQEAVRIFLDLHPDASVKFRIIWMGDGFLLPDGTRIEPDMKLENTGKVVFYRNVVSKQEVLSLLDSTDWVLLPYRLSSYDRRSSLVATDALLRGIPAIYTKGTFLEDLYLRCGSGISFSGEHANILANCIHTAYTQSVTSTLPQRPCADDRYYIFSAEYFWRKVVAEG